MNFFRNGKKLTAFALVLFTLLSGLLTRGQAYAEQNNDSRRITDQSEVTESGGGEASDWDLSDVPGDRIANSSVFQDCGSGKLYQNYQALI